MIIWVKSNSYNEKIIGPLQVNKFTGLERKCMGQLRKETTVGFQKKGHNSQHHNTLNYKEYYGRGNHLNTKWNQKSRAAFIRQKQFLKIILFIYF